MSLNAASGDEQPTQGRQEQAPHRCVSVALWLCGQALTSGRGAAGGTSLGRKGPAAKGMHNRVTKSVLDLC